VRAPFDGSVSQKQPQWSPQDSNMSQKQQQWSAGGGASPGAGRSPPVRFANNPMPALSNAASASSPALNQFQGLAGVSIQSVPEQRLNRSRSNESRLNPPTEFFVEMRQSLYRQVPFVATPGMHSAAIIKTISYK
jgi:hypothetical protein